MDIIPFENANLNNNTIFPLTMIPSITLINFYENNIL